MLIQAIQKTIKRNAKAHCCRNTADAPVFYLNEHLGMQMQIAGWFSEREGMYYGKSEQVIKDLDRVIGTGVNTDMKDIPAEEKKRMVADTIDHFDLTT